MNRFFTPYTLVLLGGMLLLSLSRGVFSDPVAWLRQTLLILPGIVIGLSFHEFAHAKVAHKLGDNLPKVQGRVTINPAAHIDVVGFIALLFVGFGWGKAVEINPDAFKKPRRDEILVAVAGVVMNLIIATVFAIILGLVYKFEPEFAATSLGDIITSIIFNIIYINLILMIFNLLPIPPLDGYSLVGDIFNLKGKRMYWEIYDKGILVLLIFIILDFTDVILVPAVRFMLNLLLGIAGSL